MRKVADRVIDAVARRAEAAREAGSSHLEVFRGLWNSDRNRQRQLEKRLREGSVEDEAGYLEKTFGVLAAARNLTIAEPCDRRLISAKAALDTGRWVVLPSENGTLITSYPANSDAKSFEDNHRILGDRVYDQDISEDYRRDLKRVFAAR